ncbi:MAG TPA: hypothetical protein PLS49_07540 [Candidatus Woesebacteria bacterium]|mgnify:CR=1 FL=1|nr:hypothetical protein [Candidatus Woesebacteria bacterium]
MENLYQFMKDNRLNKSEENKLDEMVMHEIKPRKSHGLWIFYKFALTLFLFLIIGVGVFFLPEDQQRKVVKPVSAQEVLQQTYNKLQQMVKTPGVLHYQYIVMTEHEDIEGYNNFQIDVYASTQDNKYKSSYVITKPVEELANSTSGDSLIQSFPDDEAVIYSDGEKEYYHNDYTESYRNLTPKMIELEHKNYLQGLSNFYEYLLSNNPANYSLMEKDIEAKPSYVITFDYIGKVMNVSGTNTEFVLEEKTYTAEIIVDKETMLPILNSTKVKDGSFKDTQYEKYTNFELLSPDSATKVFDFNAFQEKFRTSENPTIYETIGNTETFAGEFSQTNPGEDIITLQFYQNNNKLDLDGNLLFDRIIRKPTIVGKFLSGKKIKVSGFTATTNFGRVLWIEDIDYSGLGTIYPTTTITPTDTNVIPTPTHRLTIPSEDSFSGLVYHSEYGGNTNNAMKVNGMIPNGVEFKNNKGKGFGYITLESKDMLFRIDEWYEGAFHSVQYQPEKITTQYLGEIIEHDYTDQTIFYYSGNIGYKQSNCIDYYGNIISSPCADIIYTLNTDEGSRYLTISCEVKTTPDKATNQCREIIKDLSIAKS